MKTQLTVFGDYTTSEFLPLWCDILHFSMRNCIIHHQIRSKKTFGKSSDDFDGVPVASSALFDTKQSNASPCCFLFLQSRPYQFSQDFLDQLTRSEPLTPKILILGAALNGETRTGTPLNGCFRIPVTHWNDNLHEQLKNLVQGKKSCFDLPATMENDEFYLEWSSVRTARAWRLNVGGCDTADRQCFIIEKFGPFGNDAEMNRLLAEKYGKIGFNVYFAAGEHLETSHPKTSLRCISSSLGTRKIVAADCDDSPFSNILKAAQRLRSQFADADIRICIDSPRFNEKNDLLKLGVDRIFAKPEFFG